MRILLRFLIIVTICAMFLIPGGVAAQTAENADCAASYSYMEIQGNIPTMLDPALFVVGGKLTVDDLVEDAFQPIDPLDVVTTARANVRQSFDPYSDTLTVTAFGAIIPADAIAPNGWVRVIYRDIVGWLDGQYLRQDENFGSLPLITEGSQAPMQELRLYARDTCERPSPDYLLIQVPQNVRLALTINEVPLNLAASVLLGAPEDGVLRVVVLEGTTYLNDFTNAVFPGCTFDMINGQPVDPHRLTEQELAGLLPLVEMANPQLYTPLNLNPQGDAAWAEDCFAENIELAENIRQILMHQVQENVTVAPQAAVANETTHTTGTSAPPAANGNASTASSGGGTGVNVNVNYTPIQSSSGGNDQTKGGDGQTGNALQPLSFGNSSLNNLQGASCQACQNMQPILNINTSTTPLGGSGPPIHEDPNNPSGGGGGVQPIIIQPIDPSPILTQPSLQLINPPPIFNQQPIFTPNLNFP